MSHDSKHDESIKPMDVDVQSVASFDDYPPDENRTLHVYNENWKAHDQKVYDADKKTVLYEVTQRFRDPQITLREATSQNIVGTLHFHSFHRKMDVDFRGNKFPLSISKQGGFKPNNISYDSPSFNQAMTWEWVRHPSLPVIELVDSQHGRIARFESVVAKKKIGRIHLLKDDLQQEQVDEIVFTALSVFNYIQWMYGAAGSYTAAATASTAAPAAA